jgi:hypothetical protein
MFVGEEKAASTRSKQATHSLALELFHVKQIFMLAFCVGNLCSNKSKEHYSILMILIANTSPGVSPSPESETRERRGESHRATDEAE